MTILTDNYCRFTVFVFSCIIGIFWNALSQPARAQRLDAEIGIFADSTEDYSIYTISPDVSVEVPVGDWKVLGDWSFFNITHVLSDESDDEVGIVTGNPFVAFARSFGDKGKSHLGLGLTIPLAQSPTSGSATYQSYYYSGAMRGLWNTWLWTPEALTIVAPGRLVLEDIFGMNLTGEAGLGYLIPISARDIREDKLIVQVAGEIGTRLGVVEVGGRVQAVIFPTVDGNKLQSAVQPYLGLGFGPMFIRAALLMNLDKPLGFAFDDEGIWGLRFQFGMGA